ncbi:MAG: hypothetical protein KDK45_21955, partial [Leptospiraceae bacterium]|nr:hypothetical protein [Leptospiraceae bacterium]
ETITIQIPKEYIDSEIEILIIPKKNKKLSYKILDSHLDFLFKNPLQIPDFVPLSRDEIYG